MDRIRPAPQHLLLWPSLLSTMVGVSGETHNFECTSTRLLHPWAGTVGANGGGSGGGGKGGAVETLEMLSCWSKAAQNPQQHRTTAHV